MNYFFENINEIIIKSSNKQGIIQEKLMASLDILEINYLQNG